MLNSEKWILEKVSIVKWDAQSCHLFSFFGHHGKKSKKLFYFEQKRLYKLYTKHFQIRLHFEVNKIPIFFVWTLIYLPGRHTSLLHQRATGWKLMQSSTFCNKAKFNPVYLSMMRLVYHQSNEASKYIFHW